MRRALLVIASLVLGSVIAVIAMEGISRVLFPSWAPRTGRLAEFWHHDPVYGWAHEPGSVGRFAAHGFDTTVHINSHGFRGPERSYDKPPGTTRVVVLGDSFVWGFGVEQEELFTTLVEKQLGPGAEVVNLAVSGYSTDQELLVYRNAGHRYAPDVVVLVVASNDVADNARSVAYVVYGKPLFELEGDRLTLTNEPVPLAPLWERAVFSLARQSYVLNQLNRLRETWSLDNALETPAGQAQPVASRPFPATHAEKLTVRLIAEIRHEVEQSGAAFLVVMVDDIYAGRRFPDYLAGLGMDVLSLDDYIRPDDPAAHLPEDFHWSATGHAAVAAALTPRIEQLLAARSAAPAGQAGQTTTQAGRQQQPVTAP
ncbi:MAG: SGNH/GDSL hydrolase family protein [Gammaproteobacteria bacterium]|nr:MAG: SGNH/GDSL hydrolase family protein [Gammaproteobacteria bacterium]